MLLWLGFQHSLINARVQHHLKSTLILLGATALHYATRADGKAKSGKLYALASVEVWLITSSVFVTPFGNDNYESEPCYQIQRGTLTPTPQLQALLALKAVPDSVNSDQQTPLHWAVENGDEGSIKALIEAKAALDLQVRTQVRVEVMVEVGGIFRHA